MTKQQTQTMRDDLLELLAGGAAHLSYEDAVADLPPKLRGAKVRGVPHTPWRLIEHMRLAQHDILQFSRNPDWQSPAWPTGYWPDDDAPPTPRAWDQSVEQFHHDLEAMKSLVADEKTDLLAPIPHGQGQTLFREATLVADHNAYHLGQLIVLRRALGAWDL